MKRILQYITERRKRAVINHLEEKLRSLCKHQEWERTRFLHELIQELKIVKQ